VNLLTTPERERLEIDCYDQCQTWKWGLKNCVPSFRATGELLQRLHDGTLPREWVSYLRKFCERLDISPATAYRCMSGARELKRIPQSVQAAMEKEALDLSSTPVRRLVLELLPEDPEKIVKLVSTKYLHQRARRIKRTGSPKPVISANEQAIVAVVNVLEQSYRHSSGNIAEINEALRCVVSAALKIFYDHHPKAAPLNPAPRPANRRPRMSHTARHATSRRHA
jgi:hypothetical protein